MISLKGKSLYVESKGKNTKQVYHNLQLREVVGQDKRMMFNCFYDNNIENIETEIGISQNAYKLLTKNGYYSDDDVFMCIHHNS